MTMVDSNEKDKGKCATYCACYYRCCRPFLLRATGGCSGQLEKEMLPLPEGVSTAKGKQTPKSLLARILRFVFRFLLFLVIALQVYVFASWYCGGEMELFTILGFGHHKEKIMTTLDKGAENAKKVYATTSETLKDKLAQATGDGNKAASTSSTNNNEGANIDDILGGEENENNENTANSNSRNGSSPQKSSSTGSHEDYHTIRGGNGHVAVMKPKTQGFDWKSDPISSELPWMNKLGSELYRATNKKKQRHQPRYRYKPPRVMIKSYGSEIDAMKFVKNAIRTPDFLDGEDFTNEDVDNDEVVDPSDPEVKKLVQRLKRLHEKRQAAAQRG